MKKYLFLSLLFFFFHAQEVAFAQTYFVGFFGSETNLPTTIGHAFIGIGKGTPMTCNMEAPETEMFGFYPAVRISGGKSLWFGPVDSEVKSDINTKITSYAFKRIDFADYIKVSAKFEEWKKKKYELTRQDCIAFFVDVARLFPNLIVPDREKYILPDQYVKQFIKANSL
jgi:hypothetical protein